MVNAIDAGEVNGHYYFVMEYVEGPTIKDFLDQNRTFEEREALRIVLAIAEALKHANQRGLIHRDIKPENVILTRDGACKLADLGLARLTDDEKWGLSEAGMAIGTPYYISPEQVRGQTNVDIRADIYSLGATLYHMVTGKVPYGGETPNEVMRKHVDPNVTMIPPDHINTKLSGGLGMVVETMMAKNREHRYQTPDDLILDLKCLQRGDSPMIAGQKPEDLALLAEGESNEARSGGQASTRWSNWPPTSTAETTSSPRSPRCWLFLLSPTSSCSWCNAPVAMHLRRHPTLGAIGATRHGFPPSTTHSTPAHLINVRACVHLRQL